MMLRRSKKITSQIPVVNRDSIFAPLYDAYNYLDQSTKCKCPKNCHLCCEDYFLITEREYLFIANYLINNFSESAINTYVMKAKKIMIDFYSQHPELQFKFSPTMTHIDVVNFYRFISEESRASSDFCIFLNDQGKCDIYPVRPLICRTYGAFLTSSKATCPHKIQKYIRLSEEFEKQYYFYDVYDQRVLRIRYSIFDWFADVFPQHQILGIIAASNSLSEHKFADYILHQKIP